MLNNNEKQKGYESEKSPAIEELRKILPDRTFSAVQSIAGSALMRDKYPEHGIFASDSFWDALQAVTWKRDDFGVAIIDALSGAPLSLAEELIDADVMHALCSRYHEPDVKQFMTHVARFSGEKEDYHRLQQEYTNLFEPQEDMLNKARMLF